MNEKINTFIENLSSKAPVPGGGGASALAGALASALCSMVANLTSGKAKYAEYQSDIDEILKKSAVLSEELLALIEKDAEVFEPLSKAYGIPKDEPSRDEIMENALKNASTVPLDIMRAAKKVALLAEELYIKGSRLAISDVGVAAAACRCAVEGAIMNVYINTKFMKNREYAADLNAEAEELLLSCVSLCENIYEKVKNSLIIQDKKAIELRGMSVVEAMKENIICDIDKLKEKNITPCLAVVRVGAREDDLSYERGIKKRFEACGAAVRIIELPENCAQKELDDTVLSLNNDKTVHGILLFRPLPRHLSDENIKANISPDKDIDCMGTINTALVFEAAGEAYPPCTAQAVIELIDHNKIDLTGKRVVIVGRSMVVGKPLAALMIAKNATVTVCHTRTKNLAAECRRADIVVACAGVARMITSEFMRQGQTLIDVGINVVDGKLCGDVDYEAAAAIVDAATPVPGGVGTVTTSVLLKHTVKSALADMD